MGDRGSKSDDKSVKEQRVDGSSALNAVRCTLVAGRPVLGRKLSYIIINNPELYITQGIC
jgi:hypothetical protein